MTSGKQMIPNAPKTYLNKQGEQVVTVGFSGSRVGMVPFQLDVLLRTLEGKCGEFHHGDCIGSDAEVHDLLRKNFPDKWRIIIHPPTNPRLRAFKFGDEVRPEKPYHDRNKDIVNACNVFLATPKSTSEVGGTWNTINYFKEVLAIEFGHAVPPRMGDILLPDGRVGHILVNKKRSYNV